MSEFDLINQYFKSATSDRDDVLLGIGDDCALLSPPIGKQLAISTDTLIEGVHFPKNTCAGDIGYKALAVNLSDLAAMGATPAWVSLAISLPENNHSWLKKFICGFSDLAKQYSVSLIGGDTTCGPLSITVSIIGFVDSDLALKRHRAKAGDHVFVTDTLGEAGIGLNALLNNLPIDNAVEICINQLNRPLPAIEAGQHLLGIASSAIDISDGLYADLSHICESSGVGANITLEKLPLSGAYLNATQQQPNWQMLISAGDDYKLCFTCEENKLQQLHQIMQDNHIQITDIGVITENTQINFLLNHQVVKFDDAGFNHF